MMSDTINDREFHTYENSIADDSLMMPIPTNIESVMPTDRKFDEISNIKRD